MMLQDCSLDTLDDSLDNPDDGNNHTIYSDLNDDTSMTNVDDTLCSTFYDTSADTIYSSFDDSLMFASSNEYEKEDDERGKGSPLLKKARFLPSVTSTPKRRFSQPPRDPLTVLQMGCCGDDCLGELPTNTIREAELEFKEIVNEQQQRQYILNKITEHSSVEIVRGKKVVSTNFVIKGVPVCNKAWCAILNLSFRRFTAVVDLFKDNVTTIAHGNSGRNRMTEKTTVCLAWMRCQFERIGDYMPHKTEVHLPPTWTKESLYGRMRAELSQRNCGEDMLISRGHFQRLWNQHLPEFKIVKGKQDFPVCTTCVHLREEMAKAKLTEERTTIMKIIEQHDAQVSMERRAFHIAREKARTRQEDITTLIIDGMDQSKTNLPHFVIKDKDSEGQLQLLTHITGSLHHADVPHGKVPYAFIDLRQFPHDSNLTMNVLLQMLMRKKEILGRTLHTQLDNCYRENKNRYVLCLGSLLVEYGVFEEVNFYFLPVGHTHEDVDQMFSKIAVQLRKTNIYTLQDLQHNVSRSYTPTINVELLTELYNIKEWIEPHMAGNFGGHSKPHNFNFKRVNGKVKMRYRKWSSLPWKPLPEMNDIRNAETEEIEEGLTCLKSIPSLNDIPDWVEPSLEKLDIEAIRKQIPKRYMHRLPAYAVNSWRDFFDHVGQYEQVPEKPSTWPLKEIVLFCQQGKTRQIEVADRADVIQMLANRIEEDNTNVTIGKQGRKEISLVETVTDYSSLQCGCLVAVFCPECKDIPQIGKVLTRTATSFVLHWLAGKWESGWNPCYVGKQPWKDEQPLEAAILWGFELTAGRKLRMKTKKTLKEKYDVLIANRQRIDNDGPHTSSHT